MKAHIFVCIYFMSSFASAHETELPHVSVSGTALVKVVPDEMNWRVQVSTVGKTVTETAEEHDERVSQVLSFLKEKQVPEKDTQTSQISISENWVYRDNNRVKEGFQASTSIVFKSDDLNQYRGFWIGISKLNGVEVNSVTLDTSERIRHQNESRLKAILAAKEKAIALAEALGSVVHEPLAIEEFVSSDGSFRRENFPGNFAVASGEPEDMSSISPGTVSVTTRVNVKFRISGP